MLNNVQIQKRFTDFDLLMHKKDCWLKENLRSWNSQMKSKSVDLEINEANDTDNNCNVYLITIAAVKIKENNRQI